MDGTLLLTNMPQLQGGCTAVLVPSSRFMTDSNGMLITSSTNWANTLDTVHHITYTNLQAKTNRRGMRVILGVESVPTAEGDAAMRQLLVKQQHQVRCSWLSAICSISAVLYAIFQLQSGRQLRTASSKEGVTSATAFEM